MLVHFVNLLRVVLDQIFIFLHVMSLSLLIDLLQACNVVLAILLLIPQVLPQLLDVSFT